MTPLERLEKFVHDNYECSQLWAGSALRDWLLWAFDHGYLFLVVGRTGHPAGMAIARPLDPADAVKDSRTEHSPESSNVYIDLTIGNKASMKPLMAKIINHFGARKTISFHRYGRSQTPKVYNYTKFALRILAQHG